MIGPYAYLNDMTPYGIWKRNQEIIIPIIALFLLLIAYELRLHYLVKKRTSELSTALKEKEAAEDEAKRSRERLSRLERSGVISQLSSMIAHELKQPLASILNYANGLAQLAKMGRSTPEQTGFAVKSIKTEATRANAIVDRVRAYAKHEEGPLTELDLSDVSHKAIRTFTRNALTPVAVSDAIEPGIRVMGHELELELLTLNLIRNAGDAVKDVADPLIRVTLRRDGGKAVFQVRDNGPVVTDAVLEKLTEIEESVKPEGLGLGLAIVRDIADRHGASLSFRRNDDTGLTAEMRIDMVESKPRDTEEKTGPKGDAS
jgi:two-component system sensor histidine kinase TtrS